MSEYRGLGDLPPSIDGAKKSSLPGIKHIPADVKNAWYPLIESTSLESGSSLYRPTGACLLGIPLVIFKDGGGDIHCLEDKCPHRSAPLSIGKVVDGVLECAYHGWQLEGSTGRVSFIPAKLPEAKMPPNACARVYPCVERYGLVWVWPGDLNNIDGDGEDGGWPSSSLIPHHPIFDDKNFVCQTLIVDLPIDHSLMVENLLDPAHVPYTHDGTIGQRSKSAPLDMRVVATRHAGGEGEGGHGPNHWDFAGGQPGLRGQTKAGFFLEFQFPCHVMLFTPPKPSWLLVQFASCVPTVPGRMRFVYRAYRNWMTFFHYVPLFRSIFDRFSIKIVFQDYELLFGQQQRLREGARPWNATIQVDGLPLLYRKWHRRSFGAHSGAWWTGWDKKLTDIEDLTEVGSVNCRGCARAMPYHPQNPFQEREDYATGQFNPPSFGWGLSSSSSSLRGWGKWVVSLVVVVVAALLVAQRYDYVDGVAFGLWGAADEGTRGEGVFL